MLFLFFSILGDWGGWVLESMKNSILFLNPSLTETKIKNNHAEDMRQIVQLHFSIVVNTIFVFLFLLTMIFVFYIAKHKCKNII